MGQGQPPPGPGQQQYPGPPPQGQQQQYSQQGYPQQQRPMGPGQRPMDPRQPYNGQQQQFGGRGMNPPPGQFQQGQRSTSRTSSPNKDNIHHVVKSPKGVNSHPEANIPKANNVLKCPHKVSSLNVGQLLKEVNSSLKEECNSSPGASTLHNDSKVNLILEAHDPRVNLILEAHDPKASLILEAHDPKANFSLEAHKHRSEVACNQVLNVAHSPWEEMVPHQCSNLLVEVVPPQQNFGQRQPPPRTRSRDATTVKTATVIWKRWVKYIISSLYVCMVKSIIYMYFVGTLCILLLQYDKICGVSTKYKLQVG